MAGRVHSVFTRCVNVAWHDGRLAAFHAPGPLGAPFAAALSAVPDLSGIRGGDLVRRRGDRLRLGPIEVALPATGSPGATLVDLSIPRSGGPSDAVAEALAALPPLPGAPALGSPRAAAAQARLAAAIQDGDPHGLIDAALGLVGLGEGLTPAGDDCLVGALAALHRFGPDEVLAPSARTALRRAVPTATTALAGEFVLHALDGGFAEPIVSLLTAGSTETARRAAAALARTGATSGADTLAGIRLALDAIEARRT